MLEHAVEKCIRRGGKTLWPSLCIGVIVCVIQIQMWKFSTKLR